MTTVTGSRPVITGVGVVTSIGTGSRDFFDRLLQGRPAWSRRELFPRSPARLVAAVPDAAIQHGLPRRQARRLDRFSLLAIAAIRQAMADAGVEPSDAPERIGVLVGNATGGWSYVEPQLYGLYGNGDFDAIDSFVATAWFPTAAQGEVTILTGIAGYSKTLSAEGLSSALALEFAMNALADGSLDTVVVCGAESPLSPLVYAACEQRGLLPAVDGGGVPSDAPGAASPFPGPPTLGEGAAAVVLQRAGDIGVDVTPYAAVDALVVGGPLADTIEAAARAASAAAGGDTHIDHVVLDARGHDDADRQELRTVARLRGTGAPMLSASAPARLYGNLLGAAFAVKLVVACLVLRHGQVPPSAVGAVGGSPDGDVPSPTALSVPIRTVLVNGSDDHDQGATAVLSRVVAKTSPTEPDARQED